MSSAHVQTFPSSLPLRQFAKSLASDGFGGDYETGTGAREVASTDNSIYQVKPAAIAYPRSLEDINRIVVAAASLGGAISLTARGGNTGTNGQSLNNGVIVDFARHLNRIVALDQSAKRVVVEPGVVLDQLNAALAGHGLFFPPMVSTASRATIGGMVATDASGKGSRHYGKTSDYIEAINVVLADGTDWRAEPMSRVEAERIADGEGLVAQIHREALRVAIEHAEAISSTFPVMNRGLTGYNLQKLYDVSSDRFFLGFLLAGSEGTLAMTKTVTLRVMEKPELRALAVVRYDDFDAALRDVDRLLDADPLAVEILDDKVLGVAKTDIVWSGLSDILGAEQSRQVAAMNFVEVTGSDQTTLDERVARLSEALDRPQPAQVDARIVCDPAVVAQLWNLREKSVGLLARLGGGRQGVPFVEDTAVPPSRLADYVADFRKVLDDYGLQYGMFGHADVGCIHVRPFLDMRDPAQAGLIRPISDRVAVLTKQYGGLLWGEHGRGFRGEYSPLFFGKVLYPELERLKSAFDRQNLFNPGKLSTPAPGMNVDRIDRVPLRGESDGSLAAAFIADFDRAVACNGNGACFSWSSLDVMCPSYKATRDRAQSPKGRAALLRAWSRLLSVPSARERGELEEIEQALYSSLSSCLSCKACTTLCPVKVDVPTLKSRFLSRYFAKHRRPLRHYLLTALEGALSVARVAPGFFNSITGSAPFRWLVARGLGLVDLPAVTKARIRPPVAKSAVLSALSREQLARTVVLVEDTFTATFDGRVMESATVALRSLGYRVYRLPAKQNGKVLHLLGLRDRFARLARKRMREVEELSALGVALVGLDAATMLMFEQEYAEFMPSSVRVMGLEALLAGCGLSDSALERKLPVDDREYRLFSHCTEQALRPESVANWTSVLQRVGLKVKPVKSGCCGMAGMFGHEAANVPLSTRLFELSWRDAIGAGREVVLATGYSCRSQTKRLAGFRPRHPVELLAKTLEQHLPLAQRGHQ